MVRFSYFNVQEMNAFIKVFRGFKIYNIYFDILLLLLIYFIIWYYFMYRILHSLMNEKTKKIVDLNFYCRYKIL